MKKLQKNDRVWFYCSKRTFNFKKHLFWNGHLKSENVIFLKNYYIAPWLFFLLCRITNFYNKNSNVEDVDHDLTATFRTLNLKYSSFLELYHDIEEFTAKSTDASRKKKTIKIKTGKLLALSLWIPWILQKISLINEIFSSIFLENVPNIIFGREVIHHLQSKSKRK